MPKSAREIYEYYSRKALEVDELKATYENANWYKRAFYDSRFRVVLNALNPKDGERILDVGSGPGYYSNSIESRGAEVVALDVSRNYLVQIRNSSVERVLGDAQRLPFRSGAFDKVLATEVLEHTLQPDAVVAEIARVLRLDGKSVITAPSSASYMDLAYRVKAAFYRYAFREHLQDFTRSKFIELLARHFRVKELHFANCLLPYPLDWLAKQLPERLGGSVFARLERMLSLGRGGPVFCWTMVAGVEPRQELDVVTAL